MKELSSGQKQILRWLLLTAAAVFVLYGAYRGEIDTVLSKAIRLCMECVGIG